MQLKVTLKKVIAIVKLSLFLIWFWPLPKNASTGKMLCMKLYQLISMIFIVTGMASMLYAVVNNLAAAWRKQHLKWTGTKNQIISGKACKWLS
ncbi:hypothetical protein EAI_15345 [Harpegnathos saltator]|uniref:Uncharacterized protein n=1 Tax=Harpegnathos saltator TaxID=610380 RepID=E2BDE9_HARSA|nr:hypothetical protein EAI_15345 [Harpegnathos saltator]